MENAVKIHDELIDSYSSLAYETVQVFSILPYYFLCSLPAYFLFALQFQHNFYFL